MKKNVQVANAIALPFEDKSFDYVISINTIHNLNLKDCEKAIMEINRVSKKGAYIVVDAYSNDAEKERMFKWNLTAKTIMSVSEWKIFFKKCGYNGDYYWFIP
jgi:ubiquinone/menaquinone biosynthesis C-methylase UbiE